MNGLLLLVLVSATAFVAHATPLNTEDVVEWSLNEFSDDEDSLSYDSDDTDDSFYGNAISADDSTDFDFVSNSDDVSNTEIDDTYSLQGCHGGQCEICFKVWKFRGCFIVKIASDGIDMEFKAFGKTLYSQKLKANYTLTVKKDKFPHWMRKVMRSDLKIKVSGFDLGKKRVCVQMEVKVRFVNTLKWPRKSPHCFTL